VQRRAAKRPLDQTIAQIGATSTADFRFTDLLTPGSRRGDSTYIYL